MHSARSATHVPHDGERMVAPPTAFMRWPCEVPRARVSVRFVGERARKGESVAELLDDYPALDAEDVEFARMFVALGRPPGRPRKKLRFVRGDGPASRPGFIRSPRAGA